MPLERKIFRFKVINFPLLQFNQSLEHVLKELHIHIKELHIQKRQPSRFQRNSIFISIQNSVNNVQIEKLSKLVAPVSIHFQIQYDFSREHQMVIIHPFIYKELKPRSKILSALHQRQKRLTNSSLQYKYETPKYAFIEIRCNLCYILSKR